MRNGLIDHVEFFESLIHMIAAMFGENCEVLLHDWRFGHEHSIKLIENGHVTGRSVGNPANNVLLEVINSGQFQNKFNSLTYTEDGRVLKSSTIYITDEEQNAVGALCINCDITPFILQRDFIDSLIPENGRKAPKVDSFYARDVNNLLDYLIERAIEEVGKEVSDFTKDDRLRVIEYLDSKGALLISKSGVKICEILQISKFTLYSDLNEIKKRKEANNEPLCPDD